MVEKPEDLCIYNILYSRASEKLLTNPFPNLENLGQAFEFVANKYSNRKCLGERKMNRVETVPNNSKIPFRYDLGDYEYVSFKETLDSVKLLSSALHTLFKSKVSLKLKK